MVKVKEALLCRGSMLPYPGMCWIKILESCTVFNLEICLLQQIHYIRFSTLLCIDYCSIHLFIQLMNLNKLLRC